MAIFRNKPFIITIIILITVFMIIPASITYIVHNHYFGKRIVHENAYYEFLLGNNVNFKKEEVEFLSNENQKLRGAFYYQGNTNEAKALLVFAHGMGVNYENYLAEIEWLTAQDFIVFSYHNTGVDQSEGEDLKGLLQGPIDLQHALIYLDGLDEYKELPCILIGHSWGGFSVAAVSQLELPREVDGIITLAGFWRNINVIEDIAQNYVGDAIKVISPYLSWYEYALFREYSNLNGVTGLASTSAKVLMIHSKDDTVVSFDSNYLYYKSLFEENPRFTFKEYEEAGHKLTVNKASYERIHDIMHHQMELEILSAEYEKLEEERLSLITDFNEEVMNDILAFCNEIVLR